MITKRAQTRQPLLNIKETRLFHITIPPVITQESESQRNIQNQRGFRTLHVTIENRTGTTTLDGAKISGGSVDVTAGNLNITSAQNTASYLSTQESAEVSFAVPVYGTGGEMGFSVNAASGFLYDTCASTEVSGLSGLYAGGNGLNVTVAHNTTLNAGVMESTAASGNTVTTGT